MNPTTHLKGSFNWRMLVVRVLVNMLALFVTALVVPNIYFVNRSFLAWIALALGLGILNALIKPIIQFLTLRFIFVTGGLVLVLINAVILALLSWLFPDQLAVDGLLWPLVGGLVLGLVNALLENLLGLSPPIVSEKYPAVRRRVKDRQFQRPRAARARVPVVVAPSANGSAAAAPVGEAAAAQAEERS